MVVRKKISVFVFGLMFIGSVFAEGNSGKLMEMNADIQKGIELHNKSRTEGMATAEKASELLEPYIKENAIACAYFGSVMTVKAGIVSEKNPVKALKYLQTGGDYIDKAVELAPNEARIRMLRLENGIEVSRSSPVKRYSVIKKDVKWFIDADNISKASADLQGEAYLYCGYYMIDAGDLDSALECFEECVAVNPKSDFAKHANKMLERYTE